MLTPLLATTALLVSLQAQAATDTQTAETETQASEAVSTDSNASEANEEEKAGTETEAATDENRVICRRTQVIGSKFTKRICGTQAEWDELARKGQISTAEFQAKGAGIRQAGN